MSPPVRVLLVGPSLRFLGGQAVQARRLLERLEHEPTVAVEFLAVDPVLPGVLRLLQRIRYVRTVVTSVAYACSLVWRVPRVDVVHAYSASYWSFVLAPLPAMCAGRLFGKRVVLNYHSGEAADHLRRWGWLMRWALRLANCIVVPSPYLVDVFARFGARADAVANHLDVDRLLYRPRERLEPRFLSNRNFEAHYNIPCILRAFARIQEVHSGAALVVAGDGRERPALEGLAESLGLRHLTFTGPVPPDRMPRLYDEADVFLNASIVDNMPLSLLEAFASGLPVVSSDAGGIPYMAENERTALLVPCDDPDALAFAALRLLESPALAARLSTEGRRDVEANYAWASVRRGWLGVYEALPSA